MPLVIAEMNRAFTFKHNAETITLSDPDPAMSPEQVMSFFSNTYPALTPATVHGPKIENDKAVYEFKTTIGVKG